MRQDRGDLFADHEPQDGDVGVAQYTSPFLQGCAERRLALGRMDFLGSPGQVAAFVAGLIVGLMVSAGIELLIGFTQWRRSQKYRWRRSRPQDAEPPGSPWHDTQPEEQARDG